MRTTNERKRFLTCDVCHVVDETVRAVEDMRGAGEVHLCAEHRPADDECGVFNFVHALLSERGDK